MCCRISRTPGSPTWLVPVYINFPSGGRSSQAAPRAVQTFPLASVPYTASSGAVWMVIFLGTGSYVVGRSNMFQHCLSSDNDCDGHLGTADWRSWVLIVLSWPLSNACYQVLLLLERAWHLVDTRIWRLFYLSFGFPHPLLFQTCDWAVHWQCNLRNSRIIVEYSCVSSAHFSFSKRSTNF